MWSGKVDLSERLIKHKDYEKWFSYYVEDASFAFFENENDIFRSDLLKSLCFQSYDDIYEAALKSLSSVGVSVHPMVRINYEECETIDEENEIIIFQGDIMLDRWLLMENGCYLSVFQFFIYLSYIKTKFGNDLICNLLQFGSGSLALDSLEVRFLTPDFRQLYYACRTFSQRLTHKKGDGNVIGFKKQDRMPNPIEGYGIVAMPVGCVDSIFGENNFMTKYIPMFYVLDETLLSECKYSLSLDDDSCTYSTYELERSFVNLIKYDFARSQSCYHGQLYKDPPVPIWKERELTSDEITAAVGWMWDETIPNKVDHKQELMDYTDSVKDIVEEKKILLEREVVETVPDAHVKKVHDGQVKNTIAYLEFLEYYGPSLNEVKVVYVVGCGINSYMYTFLGQYFYDKRIVFIDKDINKKGLSVLPNCVFIEDFIDENFVFEPHSVLISDVYNDNVKFDEIIANLILQMKWASKCDYYFVKFMIPWTENSGIPFMCKFDERVLLAKSRHNSSEMRLWGCKDSSMKQLDFRFLDKSIAYFNRFKRFKYKTCYDCWRIGRYFTVNAGLYPDVITVYFSDRGYDIWRFKSMYNDYKLTYKKWTLNEKENEVGIPKCKYDPKKYCKFPYKMCNYYTGCGKCRNHIEMLFDVADLNYLCFELDKNNDIFDDLYREVIFSGELGKIILSLVNGKYEDSFKILRMSKVGVLDGPQILEWTSLNILDVNGDPVEMRSDCLDKG
jgi:hypothetical protein